MGFARDIVDGGARRVAGREILRLRRTCPARSASGLAIASASTKNRTSNMPSWPVKQTALRTASKPRLGVQEIQRHSWHGIASGVLEAHDGNVIRSIRPSVRED